VVEERRAMDVLERRAALGRRAQQPGGRRPIQLATRQDRSAQRAGDAVAQPLAQAGEAKALAVLLGEDVLSTSPRNMRVRASASAPTASAISRPVRGPKARTSATPSLAAT
jgi:hypothetical protein